MLPTAKMLIASFQSLNSGSSRAAPSQDWKANWTKAEWYLWVMDKPLKRRGSWEKVVGGSFSELLWTPSFPLPSQKVTNLGVAWGDDVLTFCPQISLPYPLKELSFAADFESIIAGFN